MLAENFQEETAEKEDTLLGQRVRTLRQKANLSLTQLSKATGLSTGMLSQLERGLSTPSLRTLRLLSTSFSVPVTAFFDPAPPSDEAEFIVRKERRRVLNLSQVAIVKELLSPAESRNVTICNLKIGKGGKSDTKWLNNAGQKAGIVTRGQIRLFINNKSYLLEAGDSFSFDGSHEHRFENAAADDAEMIWIFVEAKAGGSAISI